MTGWQEQEIVRHVVPSTSGPTIILWGKSTQPALKREREIHQEAAWELGRDHVIREKTGPREEVLPSRVGVPFPPTDLRPVGDILPQGGSMLHL